MLTFKAVHKLAPEYLCNLVKLYEPTRSLRSSSYFLLVESRTKLKCSGDRAFAVYGPKLWNQLPESTRRIKSLDTFKTTIKTMLFNQYFN